jgi:hypothetical protein
MFKLGGGEQNKIKRNLKFLKNYLLCLQLFLCTREEGHFQMFKIGKGKIYSDVRQQLSDIRPSVYHESSHSEIPIVKNGSFFLVLEFPRREHNL